MKMRPVKSFSLFETLNHDWLTIERRGMQGSRSFNYEWENIDGRFNNRRYRLFRKRIGASVRQLVHAILKLRETGGR